MTATSEISLQNGASINTSVLFQGAGTINCASLTVGGTTTPTVTSSDYLTTLTSTVSNLSVSGNLSVNALYNSLVSAANQGVFALSSGTVTVNGGIVFVTVPLFGPTLTLASGNQNGTLILSGSTPFTITGGGSSTFTANGTNATVNYSGAAQTVQAATYQNLILSGSGTKTTAGVSVNGTLSLQGTASVSAAPTYGPNATLQYAGSAAQTQGPELPATIPSFTINNASGVTLTNSTTVSNTLSLVSGNVTTATNKISLAANGSISGGSSTSYVNGNLQKTFSAGTQTFTFPIGDSSSYTPLALSNLSVTSSGSLKANTTAGSHPKLGSSGLDSNRNVNRYWTLTQSGGAFGTYNATFNYPATNVDSSASPAQFTVLCWSNSAWSATVVSGIPTTNSTSISGQNGFGDFVIGNVITPAQMLSGSYTGNGTDNRAITGLGFQPDVVIVKSASTNAAVIRTSTMSGDNTKEMVGATGLVANRIQSLDTNGFTVGTDAEVNSSGVAYYWTAFKAGSGQVTVGTYTGDGTSSHAIPGLGFSPKLVFFMSVSNNNFVMASTNSALTYQLDAFSGNTMVNSFDTNGFTLGSDARVNGSAITYHYVAWNVVAGELATGSYSGSGTDNQNITGVGFQPEFVLIKSTSAFAGVHHPQSLGGTTDQSQYFTATANVTNEIQALQTNGFQVGTAQEVNQAGVPYIYFAWKKTILPVSLAITSVNGGASPTAGTAFSVVVQSQDVSGNPANVVSNTPVSLSLNTGGGILGGTLTGTIAAGTSSVTISGLTYTKAESGVVLTATRIGGDALTADNSSPFTVNPGAFTGLQLLMPGETAAPGSASGKTGTPTAQTAGSAFTVTVNAVDANWNPVSSTHTVGITSSDANAVLPANAALVAGTKTFSVTFKTAGSRTVTATDITDGTKTANTSPATAVNAGAFTQVQVLLPGETAAPGTSTGKTGTPAKQTAGTAFSGIVVNAVDANWNLVNTVTDTVQIYTSSDPNASLPTAAALAGGAKTFSVTFKTAGSQTVTAKDTTTVMTENTSTATTVIAGSFAKLQLLMPGETAAPGTASGKTGSPTAQTVGTPFTVTVNTVDANWNGISTNDTVAITSSDSNAILPANAALNGGTQTFSLTFKTAGSQTATSADVTHAGITANTGSATTVNPCNQTITFPSPGNQTYGIGPLTLGATASSSLAVSYSVTSGSATVSSNVLTITGAGSVTIQALQSGNANWNAATPVNQTISIAQKTVTGTITASNKTYDATTAATIATRTLSGVTNSDVVSLTGGTATFVDKNVANGKTVIAIGLSLTGANAGNYVLASTSATNTANITKATLTVSAAGVNKVYDGTTNATVTLSDNRLTGDVLTTSYTTAGFADKNVGTGKTASVSGISATGTDSGNYTANTTASTTANITKATLAVSAAGVNKVYDGTTNATVTLSDNRLAGDSLTTSYAAASFADKNVGNSKTVTVTGIIVSGTDSGNYTANTTVSTTANITKATLTVSAAGVNKIYDGTTNATVTLSDNRLTGDVLTTSYAAASFPDKNVGNGKTVTVTGIAISGTDSGNYTANTTASTTANIMAATIMVSANNTNRPYGTPNPTFTASYNGFVNGEGADVLSGSPGLSTTASANSPVGDYPIQISQGTLSSPNYIFSLTAGTLTVIEVPSMLNISLVGGTGSRTNRINLYCAGLTPGGTYYINASTNLVEWQQIVTLLAAQDGTITFTDTNAVQCSMCFYRLSGD
ncbi:MAG: beta strand repeat-containing protein [Limisphaerales bacterium]